MLFHKPKQHAKQCTGLKFVIYIEMTDKKFSLTSQCHKSTILHIMFIIAIWPGRLITQQPVNAGSSRIGVKTARPGVDFRTH